MQHDISIEDIRSLPKAAAQTKKSNGRKRRRCAVLTSPEMIDSLRAEQEILIGISLITLNFIN